jgi:hypothetical protein
MGSLPHRETLPRADEPEEQVIAIRSTEVSMLKGIRRTTAVLFAAGSATALLAPSATAADSGLAAAWSFDEASGAIVSDLSGAGQHAVATKVRRTSGRHGGALLFNGRSSRFRAPLDGTPSALTVEAWVKPTAKPKRRTVLLGAPGVRITLTRARSTTCVCTPGR